MDVSSTSPAGMTPHLSHRALLPGRVLLHGRPLANAGWPTHASPPSTVIGGGGATAATPTSDPAEIGGTPDGPDVVLASGVHVRRLRIGANTVGAQQLQQAIQGIAALPLAHQQLLARLGIPVELVPVTQLERVTGATAPVVGATRVIGAAGNAHAERLRIAAYQAAVGTSVVEATQHEIGHVVAVTTQQDLSEETAIRYAASY